MKRSSSIKVFQGASASYSAEEFLNIFDEWAKRRRYTDSEKFTRVFDYIDESLHNVVSIIQTCSYNNWQSFENLFKTAYFTESHGIPYVQHLIRTFNDKSSGFGIHIFLECFFTYTKTLCKQGLMSYGERFSLLTFALPPNYISFIRCYSDDANVWISGMPVGVPTEDSKWDELFHLTKQYADAKEPNGYIANIQNDRHSTRRKKKKERSNTSRHSSRRIASPNAQFFPDSVLQEMDCSLQQFDESLNHNYLSAGNYRVFHSAESTSSTVPSPSIISTPSEYLAPLDNILSLRLGPSLTSHETRPRTHKLSVGRQLPSNPGLASTLHNSHSVDRAPDWESIISDSKRTESSSTDNTNFSGATADTRSTSPYTETQSHTLPVKKALYNHSDNSYYKIIHEYQSNSNLAEVAAHFSKTNISKLSHKTSTAETISTTSDHNNDNRPKLRRMKSSISNDERQVWQAFVHAHGSVNNLGNSDETESYDVDEILDSTHAVSSTTSVNEIVLPAIARTLPDISLDYIMSEFSDPRLIPQKEQDLVIKYSEVITQYPMSYFIKYPENLLKHVFEMVLRYVYSHNTK